MKYILKTTKEEGISYNDFQWPTEVGAKVTAPDWNPKPECGNGLHGWLNGEGNGTIGHINTKGCIWMVLGVEGEIVELQGKVKFKECTILHVGDQLSATQFLRNLAPESRAMIGESLIVGDNTMEMVGDYGSITGGEYSTLIGGYESTLTGGDNSTLTGGYKSTLTGGDDSTITGGNWSTLTGGYESTLTGGEGSTLTFKIWDDYRYRLHTFYVGEDGVEPNVAYKFEYGKIVKV